MLFSSSGLAPYRPSVDLMLNILPRNTNGDRLETPNLPEPQATAATGLFNGKNGSTELASGAVEHLVLFSESVNLPPTTFKFTDHR